MLAVGVMAECRPATLADDHRGEKGREGERERGEKRCVYVRRCVSFVGEEADGGEPPFAVAVEVVVKKEEERREGEDKGNLVI